MANLRMSVFPVFFLFDDATVSLTPDFAGPILRAADEFAATASVEIISELFGNLF